MPRAALQLCSNLHFFNATMQAVKCCEERCKMQRSVCVHPKNVHNDDILNQSKYGTTYNITNVVPSQQHSWCNHRKAPHQCNKLEDYINCCVVEKQACQEDNTWCVTWWKRVVVNRYCEEHVVHVDWGPFPPSYSLDNSHSNEVQHECYQQIDIKCLQISIRDKPNERAHPQEPWDAMCRVLEHLHHGAVLCQRWLIVRSQEQATWDVLISSLQIQKQRVLFPVRHGSAATVLKYFPQPSAKRSQ